PRHILVTRVVSTLVLLLLRPPRASTLFPYTTLFRSARWLWRGDRRPAAGDERALWSGGAVACDVRRLCAYRQDRARGADSGKGSDRKSTRLNSSHVKISYAVFCLKKKKHIKIK